MTDLLAVAAAVFALAYICGYPMRFVEEAVRDDGCWTHVFRDRRGRCWLASGRWDLFRRRAAFDMQGFWCEAGPEGR